MTTKRDVMMSEAEQIAREFLASQGFTRTAGEIRHVKDSGPVKRKGIDSHSYSQTDLKVLTRILWQLSVSLGHLSTANSSFTRLKSVKISPDGMLGGHGYDMSIKDIRKKMAEAVESLSGLVDTLHDEVTAPHWHPELLPKEEADLIQQVEEEVHIQEGDSFMDPLTPDTV